MKNLLGVLLIIGGVASLGYWIDRSFFHPTAADRERTETIAEYGGISALTADSRKIFLIGGIVMTAVGAGMASQTKS